MIRRLLLVLVFCFSLSGCGGGDNLPENYIAARASWQASHISDYRFTLTQVCLCPTLKGSPVIVVRGGRVASAYYPDGTPVDAITLDRLPSMANLFTIMENAYAQNLSVRFVANSPYGDLSEVYIDYIKEAADDELWYVMRDFVVEGG